MLYLCDKNIVYMNSRRIDQIHELLGCKLTYDESVAMNKEKLQPMIKLNAIRMQRPNPENWSRETVNPRRFILLESLWQVFQSNKRTTVTVVVEGEEFHCHNIVLRAIIPFFRDLEYTETIDLPTPMFTAHAFAVIYRYVMQRCPVLKSGHFIDVFRAAHFIRWYHLVAYLWHLMDRECQKYPETCVYQYQNAISRSPAIEKTLFERLGPWFLPIAASFEFLQMEVETVCRLICMDTVAVNTEMEVLMAAIMWLDYQWPKRQSHIVKVLAGVDFELIPFLDLLTLSWRTEGPPVLLQAMTNTEIKNRIRMALDKLCCIPTKFRGCCFDNNSRLWAYDPYCVYHHSSKCSTTRYLTYNLFVSYLRWLQSAGSGHCARLKFGKDLEILCCPPKS